MTNEINKLREQLNDLQKKLDHYDKRIKFYENYGCNEKADVQPARPEHDSILDSVEKMRAIRANDNERH